MSLLALLWATTAPATPLPAGDGRRTIDLDGTPVELYTYKPANYAGGPLLVSFHGLSRNVIAYREATKAIANKRGLLVVLPLFDRERFPYWRYQALGITRTSRNVTEGPIAVEPESAWTAALILRLIGRVLADEGRPDLDYYLIGHSAGGQIANRLAAFAPHGAKRIVIANPSSYVQPTRDARFPYGFGDLPETMNGEIAIRRYLAQPITLLVGPADVHDKDLDVRPAAMRQGATRHERARNIFNAAREVARANGWPFNWQLIEVPDVGHDAQRMYASPQALAALFGD
ncbi:MAG: hypothetical protein OEZ08_18445 [Betaproteobacteria bacterium]|nr:hypothetical protein [Betaproteobacteria bacterium]